MPGRHRRQTQKEKEEQCKQEGHAEIDSEGKCSRCGWQIDQRRPKRDD